jgi:hypothetical protein
VTREAAYSGFERFVEDAIEYTAREFSVSRALRQGSQGASGRIVDRLLKDSETLWAVAVQPELDAYRDQILAQFEVALEYIESDEDLEFYREELLETDVYADALRADLGADRRETVLERLFERQGELAAAVEPVVTASEDEFWAAAESAFERSEAETLVEEHFRFSTPMETFPDAFRMGTRFDPEEVLGGLGALLPGLPEVEVTYTDEALRSMRAAEKRVITETKRELDRRF